ncbi:MAG: hypothetical protein ACE15C_12920 [Phycisphaerae bacterium]
MRGMLAATAVIGAALLVLAMGGSPLGALAPTPTPPSLKMAPPADYPNAGITAAMPAGFESQALGEPFDVARSVQAESGRPSQAVTISAYPIGEKVTADKFAEAMTAEFQKMLPVTHFKVVRSGTMQVGGVEAQTRTMQYDFRGIPSIASRAYFVREEKTASGEVKQRICYVLTVESVAERPYAMAAAFAEVAKSIKLTPIQRPMAVGIKDFEPPLKEFKLGYEIRPPHGWYINLTSTGVEMAQTDYVLGGVPMPLARVLVADTVGDEKAEDIAKRMLETYKKSATDHGHEVRIISPPAAAKMGGVDGCQFVAQQLPSKLATKAAGDESAAVFVIQRTIVASGGADGKPRSFSLRLYCQSPDIKAAEGIMDKLAGTFQVIAPPPATASGPATPAAK